MEINTRNILLFALGVGLAFALFFLWEKYNKSKSNCMVTQ